mgnify:CR=1 FL=1
MITEFMSNKTNLNILQLLTAAIIIYLLSIRLVVSETILLVFLISFYSTIIHIKAVVKGMIYAQEDPILKQWVNSINKMAKRDRKNKED